MAKEILELEVKSNVGEVSKEVEDLGDASKKSKGPLRSLSGGFRAIGVAIKGAGIGLVIAGFLALKEALGKNQKTMDAVSAILTTISTTFGQIVDVLVDTYNQVTSTSKNFDAMGKVLKGIVTIALTPMKLAFDAIILVGQEAMLLFYKVKHAVPGNDETKKINELKKAIKGTKADLKATADAASDAAKEIKDNAAEAYEELGNIASHVAEGMSKINIKANYDQAKTAVALKNNAILAASALQGLIEENDLLAEKQRQIRDNETKSFADRIAANEELGKILEKQEKDMKSLANTRIAAAQFEADQNKGNIELQAALQDAINEKAAVEAQIAGFKSEQLTNQVTLERELAEVQKQIQEELLEGVDRELIELENSYKAKKEMAEKAGMETVEITKKYELDRAKIIKDANKEELDDAKAVQGAKIGIAKQSLNIIGEIAGEGTKLAKATAVAQATISGIEGVQNAYTTAQGSPYTTLNPAYPLIQAGLAATFSALQIRKILSGGTPDTSGGGGGGGGAQPPAPQLQSGAFTLSGGQAPEPVKAFVVTDEMTNSQDQLANIRRRATI
tara:strand:+ start:149 stop:1837 length:1689 start_codon:yes stop_codon:yes gene_type:complete